MGEDIEIGTYNKKRLLIYKGKWSSLFELQKLIHIKLLNEQYTRIIFGEPAVCWYISVHANSYTLPDYSSKMIWPVMDHSSRQWKNFRRNLRMSFMIIYDKSNHFTCIRPLKKSLAFILETLKLVNLFCTSYINAHFKFFSVRFQPYTALKTKTQKHTCAIGCKISPEVLYIIPLLIYRVYICHNLKIAQKIS